MRTYAGALVVLLTLSGCGDGRAGGDDGGGGGGGAFESGLLSKSRAVAELSDSEALLLCEEVRDYINGGRTPEEWEEDVCTQSEGWDEASAAECEARVDECVASGSWDGFDYTYSARCTFSRRLTCTLTVEDIERCAQELADEIERIADAATCAYAGGVPFDLELELSPGCQAAYESDCACVMAYTSGFSSRLCP